MKEPEPDYKPAHATHDGFDLADSTYPIVITGARLDDLESRLIYLLRLVWTLQQKHRKIVHVD